MTYIHTAESILNLCMHTEPDTAGAEATVQYSILYLAQNPDIYQCIHSSRDRLRFYPEIPMPP